jgi:hypothetical protein
LIEPVVSKAQFQNASKFLEDEQENNRIRAEMMRYLTQEGTYAKYKVLAKDKKKEFMIKFFAQKLAKPPMTSTIGKSNRFEATQQQIESNQGLLKMRKTMEVCAGRQTENHLRKAASEMQPDLGSSSSREKEGESELCKNDDGTNTHVKKHSKLEVQETLSRNRFHRDTFAECGTLCCDLMVESSLPNGRKNGEEPQKPESSIGSATIWPAGEVVHTVASLASSPAAEQCSSNERCNLKMLECNVSNNLALTEPQSPTWSTTTGTSSPATNVGNKIQDAIHVDGQQATDALLTDDCQAFRPPIENSSELGYIPAYFLFEVTDTNEPLPAEACMKEGKAWRAFWFGISSRLVSAVCKRRSGLPLAQALRVKTQTLEQI